MRPIQVAFLSNRCSCGALLEKNARQCSKCRNRARWLRRKIWRQHSAAYLYSNTEIPSGQRR